MLSSKSIVAAFVLALCFAAQVFVSNKMRKPLHLAIANAGAGTKLDTGNHE